MTKPQYEVFVISPDHWTRLGAQIHYNNIIWAEINQEHGDLELELYGGEFNNPVRIPLEIAVSALNEAKQRLAGR